MNATKFLTIASVAAALTACVAVTSAEAHTPTYHRSASISQIEAELSSHGQFIVLSDFGRVWRPYGMPADWAPYTRGYWDYEDDAWVWHSEFTWGWAAFHYGRWAYDPVYGWVWVPGSEWGPAWVAWTYDVGYVGWAPLPPGSLWIGSGWSLGFYPNSWCYASRGSFGRRRAFTRYAHGKRRHGHAVAHRAYPAPSPARGTTHNARPAGESVARGRAAKNAHAPIVEGRSVNGRATRPNTDIRRGVVDLGTINRGEPRPAMVPARPATADVARKPHVGSPSNGGGNARAANRSPLREVGTPVAPSRSRPTYSAPSASRPAVNPQRALVPSRPATAPRPSTTYRSSPSSSSSSSSRSTTYRAPSPTRSTPSFSRAPRPSSSSSSSSSKSSSSSSSSSSKSSSRSSSHSTKSSSSRGHSVKRR